MSSVVTGEGYVKKPINVNDVLFVPPTVGDELLLPPTVGDELLLPPTVH